MPSFLSQEAIAALKDQEASLSQKEGRLPRTPEQIEAIYSSGMNILVSASAGSGKTFVMVERIIDKLKRGVSIQQLFISTFTVKAAGELKERIEAKLTDEIAKTSQADLRQHLSAQLAQVQTADIGTMDAFTQKLVNTYGYTLGISPGFRMMDDSGNESVTFKQEVYDDLLQSYMTGNQAQSFNQLVRNFTKTRKDSKNFQDLVNQIYSFSQSTANPKRWLQETFLKAYETDFDQQVEAFLAPYLKKQDFQALIQKAQLFFRQHLDTVRGEFQKNYKYLPSVEELLVALEALDPSAPLDSLAKQLQPVVALSKKVTMRIGSAKDEALREFSKAYNQERSAYLDPFLDLAKALSTVQVLRTYQPQALPFLRVLRDFVLDFSQQYFQRKKQENLFEFNDIAHLAIEILEADDNIRQLYQDKYQEVMVDEYQDNNHMQERLLDLLSNGHNRFMVGDIKQSIYRFRHADPMIFREKFKAYDQLPDFDAKTSPGLLILLKENFRSHIEVLEATNQVFSRLMDETIGEIAYDESQQLVAGNAQKAEKIPANRTQVMIYNQDQAVESQEEEASSRSDLSIGEVKLVVQEIIRLHQKEGVAFKDISLLVSGKTRNDKILETFEQYGLPLVIESKDGHYLKSVEILIMLDTLRTINNPLQDQSLVALLKSPMFRFGEDLLTRIALQASQGNFYEKLLLALNGKGQHPELIGPDLRAKLAQFQGYLDKWRQDAKRQGLYDLIWEIYQDRFYYDYVGALANGQQRQANLYALALRADQFEQSGFKGLPRFIQMIDQIIATDNDLADVEVARPKDAVHLTTIHKSKGLEYPYVFVLNLDASFNKKDRDGAYNLTRQNGLGIKYAANVAERFPEAHLDHLRVSINTLPYSLNQQQLLRDMLSEEMRKLYVAMTRAETRLYLVGRASKEKMQDRYVHQRQQERLSLEGREKWTSFQDWFLALDQNFPEDDLGFDVHYVSDQDLEEIGDLAPQLPLDVEDLSHNRQSEDILQALDALEAVEQLNQKYAPAINLPTVRTPSQIKKFYQPVLEEEGLDIMETREVLPDFKLPQFTRDDQQVTGAEVGSATHELMQRLPLKPSLSLADLQASLKEVGAEAAVKKRIDLQKILSFFQTDPLGQQILANRDRVVREAPFAMLYQDQASGEETVIRGIVDGYIPFEDRIILFDYKTDHYQNSKDLVARYQDQMALYARALQQSFGVDKVDKYLILLGGPSLVVEKL